MPEILLSELQPAGNKNAIVFNVVMKLTGGGGSTGAKHQQKLMQQAALASYLLEQGFELQWITHTVDTLSKQIWPRTNPTSYCHASGNTKDVSLQSFA